MTGPKTNRLKYGLLVVLGLLFTFACKMISSVPGGSSNSTNTPATTAFTPPASLIPTVGSPPSTGWIAFINHNNVWLIHPDGSDLKQITTNPIPADNSFSHNITIKWSPDGQRLAFGQGGRIYLLDIATFTTRLLVDDTEGGFDWSPTSNQIIYDDVVKVGNGQFDYHNSGFRSIDVENRNTGLIVKTTDEYPAITKPQWSLDGSHVIFSDPGGFEPGSFHLTEIGSGKFTTIPPEGNPGGISFCNWSPRELVIVCMAKPTKVFFLDGNGIVVKTIPIPAEMSLPGIGPWSPDGRKIAITFYTGAMPALKAMTDILSIDTGDFESLGSGFATDWSPDGQWAITWNSTWQAGNNVLPMTLVNINSGQSFQISEGYDPAWQPSGSSANGSPSSTSQPDLTPTTPRAASSQPTNPSSSVPSLCTDSSITLNHTAQGDYLHMCANNQLVEVGPLEKGAYAMGPNGKFFVYCTNSGFVYAARVGDTNLTPIGNVKDFSIIKRGEAPQLEFQFLGDNPYTVQIRELILNQNKTLSIPHYITTSK